jgi:uncharacterized protein
VNVKPHMTKKRGVKSRTSSSVANGQSVYVVGLISDTHGLVRPEIAQVFDAVDLIVHAGDVGGRGVLEALRRIAPTEAVYGNVDDRGDPFLVRERTLPIGQLTLHVSHGHELGSPSADLVLARYAGDVLVFGHTHRSLIERRGGRLVVNPGAAGPRRFDVRPSVARLTVEGTRVDVEIVPL